MCVLCGLFVSHRVGLYVFARCVLLMCVYVCLCGIVFFKKAVAGFVCGSLVCCMCGVFVWFVFVSVAFVCSLIKLWLCLLFMVSCVMLYDLFAYAFL